MATRLAGVNRGEIFSSDAARAPEGGEGKDQHQDGVNESEAEEPGGGTAVPLAPGGDGSVDGEQAEESASGFMKELADGAPDDAKRDLDGVPQNGMKAGRHTRILVQNEGRGR